MQLDLPSEPLARFAERIDRILAPGERLGIAVSGGPDSLALLLLAAAARPGGIEAASVDHGLRPESAAEAAAVARLCERLGVPHAILTAQWAQPPTSAVQERARIERYRLLGNWVSERGLAALATAHHLDDQAETLLMRLNRGAGIKGLGAIRPSASIPGTGGRLVRPLLTWSRDELAAICAAAGVEAVRDPSNSDTRFERARVRNGLAEAKWLDPRALARSALILGAADASLDWAAAGEWKRGARREGGQISYRPAGAPSEIRRRIVRRAILALATEGDATTLRGPEVDRLMRQLTAGETGTLRGVMCSGGPVWTFGPAPKRRLH